MSLAPVLLEVEKSVELVIEGRTPERTILEQTFARARSFLLQSEGLFREVQQTLLTDAEGLQKLELAEQEMAHSRASLDRLEEASLEQRTMVLRERLQTFLGSAQRCNDQFSEFAHLASQQRIYSPMPAFDAFIKAGLKVLDGQLDPALLHGRTVTLLPELGRLERLVGLLPLVHTVEESLSSGLQQALSDLQSGFGAVGTYFQGLQRPALEDGLRLMGRATTSLAQQLYQAEQLVAQEKTFTTFRTLEEWLLLRKAAPAVPVDWVVGTVSDFFRSWDFLLSRGEQLLSHPLMAGVVTEGGLQSMSWPSHKQLRESVGRSFSEIPPDGWMTTPDEKWSGLVGPLEALERQVKTTQQALEEQMAPFQELPGLERIATLKEAVKAGEVEASVLQQEFDNQLRQVEQFLATLGRGQDPISEDFADLLPIHRGAFIGMKENLEAGNWEGLEGLWQGVLTTLPSLAALSRAVRERLASESSAARQVNCLRCSEPNEPSRRVCSSCGANLPAVVQKAQETVEIGVAGEPPSGGGFQMGSTAIEVLESLVEAMRTGQITREQAGITLKSLIAEVDANRKIFAARVLPLMGKDQTLDAYLRLFAQVLGTYFAGVMQMHEFTEGGSPAVLNGGLSTCREALESLESMKSLIEEALRG